MACSGIHKHGISVGWFDVFVYLSNEICLRCYCTHTDNFDVLVLQALKVQIVSLEISTNVVVSAIWALKELNHVLAIKEKLIIIDE